MATGAAAQWAVGGARAAEPVSSLAVDVGNPSIAALVDAIGGSAVRVTLVSAVAQDSVRIAGRAIPVTDRVLLKGKGKARSRFLDDARNATRVAANVQKILAKAVPPRADNFAQAYRTWARDFARSVFDWSQRLQKSPVRGQTIRDVHGRIYLLEWAGGKVDPKSSNAGPPRLDRLPAAPAKPTMVAYRAYVDTLVSTMVASAR